MGRTAKHAPELVSNVRAFLGSSTQSAKVLIDHDTGQPVASYAKNLSGLRGELTQRRKELPALFAGVKAITSVPGQLSSRSSSALSALPTTSTG